MNAHAVVLCEACARNPKRQPTLLAELDISGEVVRWSYSTDSRPAEPARPGAAHVRRDPPGAQFLSDLDLLFHCSRHGPCRVRASDVTDAAEARPRLRGAEPLRVLALRVDAHFPGPPATRTR